MLLGGKEMCSKDSRDEGRSLEEARLAAVRPLESEADQAWSEVFDEGRRGHLDVSEPLVASRMNLQNTPDGLGGNDGVKQDVDGMVEVKNGKVRVYDPCGRGHPAVVIPAQGVVLRVNGVAVHGPQQVWEGERVELELLEEVHPAGVEVDISEDGFTASIKVTPQITVRYELIDQEPKNTLQLLTKRHVVEVKMITLADVEAALREKGVVFGIDRQEIIQAVSLADGRPRVVARGEPVQEGRDGWIECHFHNEPVKVVYEDDSNVNYWERYIIPSVAEGDVLAVVHPPVLGVPGRKVTGETVEPHSVREVTLRVKDGVVLEDNGRRAVAAVAGRPVLEGAREPCLKIEKVLVHPSDVDFKSGNLNFGGDLLILGSVKEGMRVLAKGDITVMGNITGAIVNAGGRVVCRGKIINSRVSAGGLRSFYSRISPLLKNLGNRLDEIVKEAVRIYRHASNEGKVNDANFTKIIKLLVEKRKKEIVELSTRCAAVMNEAELPFPPVIKEFTQEIKELLNVLNYLGCSDAEIKEKLKRVLYRKDEITSLLGSIPEQPGDLICSYVQNSVLNAGGSIVLTSDGGYFSNLAAGKDVRVRGVFRGGEISASGSVYVDEVGSPGLSGGKAKIRVDEDAAVYLYKVYPETTVQVGGRFYCFDSERNNVKVFLNDDEISVEPI